MAYGVKFRLEFSDDNLKGKKVEILKDGYTGSVLDLIGTDNPVEIDWEGDDDFYNPIIGSTCTINLYQHLQQNAIECVVDQWGEHTVLRISCFSRYNRIEQYSKLADCVHQFLHSK